MTAIREGIAKLFYSTAKSRVLKFLNELSELQWLSQAELAALQQQQLASMLEYANKHIPYYRESFKNVGFTPSDFAKDPTHFNTIPLLTKEDIRQNQDGLTTDEREKRQTLIRTKTGGTTGEPLWLMQEPAYRDYNTAHVYHKMTWSGWRIGEPQAWLWGHAVVGQDATRSYSTRAKDWLANRIESNAFHITEESLERLARRIEKQPGSVVWSYVSTMYKLAQFLDQRGHSIQARAVYTAAEPLYDHQRAFIESVLGCPVFDNYSCVEVGSIACECDRHDGLHITTRNCYVEVLQDGKPVPDGEEGELVLTTLTNYGFPLIRYRIEDWGKKSTRTCACGRGLPLLEIVAGRIIDHFKTRDGRLVWAAFLIPMVPTLGPVTQYQIVQKTTDLLVLRVITTGPIDQGKFQEIQRAVKTVMGDDVAVKLEYVESLPKTPTGKHRYTVCEVE